MDITAILSKLSSGGETIDESVAKEIALAFESAVAEKANAQVALEVEKAINEMDQDHANKLKQLVAKIDEDHTTKLQEVLESVNTAHAAKVSKISAHYHKALNERAAAYSGKIVEEMSNYLDLYLDKIVPKEQLAEAVANVSAKQQLEQIKKIISFDPASLNEDFKRIVLQGKAKIDELQAQLSESYKENVELNESVKASKSALLIEQRTKGMNSTKKEFIAKFLSDKTPEYIKENFDYVVGMFEREDRQISRDAAEAARSTATTKDAKIPSVVTESKVSSAPVLTPLMESYLTELKTAR